MGNMPKRDEPTSESEPEIHSTASSHDEIHTRADPSQNLPERIGDCRIKRVIASGGMGTVYEAVQEHPRRAVAVKVMKKGITSRSALRRFEYESQILARLRHPGTPRPVRSKPPWAMLAGTGEFIVQSLSPMVSTSSSMPSHDGRQIPSRR